MAHHVHIHLHRATKDNAAHDPKNGQFTSGSGGGGGKAAKPNHGTAEFPLSERQAKLREMGSPRYSGRPTPGVAAKAPAKAHLKSGGEVFTTHRNTPTKATYIGPDPKAGINHHEIQVGNSRVSVPEHDLHASREAAHASNNGQFTSGSGGGKAPASAGKHEKRMPVGSHVIHSSGAYAGKVVKHEGEHVHVENEGKTRKLLGGLLEPDRARHIDPKSAANAYKGTHAGPLHIGSTSEKK